METITKAQIIISVFSAVLSSCILNTIITHILYSRKLKKEQKMKSSSLMGDKISESLIAVKEMVAKSETIEIYNAKTEMRKEGFCTIEKNTIYPEFMNDPESLMNFHNEINSCRRKYEKTLDCKTAINLLFIDRYIKQLMIYLSGFQDKRIMPALGTIIIFDIQAWQKRCNRGLVYRINNQKYKLEYQDGYKWKILRKQLLERKFRKTILYALCNDKSKFWEKEKNQFIKQVINEMKTNPESFADETNTVSDEAYDITKEFAETCKRLSLNEGEQLLSMMKQFIEEMKASE